MAYEYYGSDAAGAVSTPCGRGRDWEYLRQAGPSGTKGCGANTDLQQLIQSQRSPARRQIFHVLLAGNPRGLYVSDQQVEP